MCKDLGSKLAAENYASMEPNPVAVQLGLDDAVGPTPVLEQARAGSEPQAVYAYLLEALDKLFDGEMEQATFEEHMRWFFGNSVGTTINLPCSPLD